MSLMIWNESTREELRRALPKSVVILPTGATEQHGPHLVTGHDTFSVAEVARQAATLAADQGSFVLAPTLPFGSSHHHLPFGGTLSLSTETYYRVVRDLVESIVAGGARRIFVLNGHGGNHELIQLVARDVALDQLDVAIAAASYWEIARASLAAEPDFAEMTIAGHAGQFETSTMLAMNPGFVREPRATRESDPFLRTTIPGTRIEASGAWQSFDGFTDFPHLATADLGVRLLAVITRDVASALTTFATDSSLP